MVIFQVGDLASERARIASLGVRIVWEVALEDAATIHLHPRDVGGAIVSLDQMSPPESWRWAGPDWKSRVRTDDVTEIIGVTIQSDDPSALARRWAEVLGGDPPRVEGGEVSIQVGSGSVRFTTDRDGRGPGLLEVELRVKKVERLLERARARQLATSRDAFEACGARFRLSSGGARE
jgi:hypothetical protein